MFFVYIIKNKEGHKYTGSTNNLEQRLSFHNDTSFEKAKFHRTTYRRGPWNIIYQKTFETRKEALIFEKYLKTGAGRNWLERARHGG